MPCRALRVPRRLRPRATPPSGRAGGGPRRPRATPSSRGRVSGRMKKKPTMSVTNPGVSSSVPPMRTSAASASCRLGIRPLRSASCRASQVRDPSRLTIHAPSSDSRTSRTRVCQPPMTRPTAMMTAISRMGRTSRARKIQRSTRGRRRGVPEGTRPRVLTTSATAALAPPTEEAADLLRAVPHAPAGDEPERLGHDLSAHLRVADLALDEGDRHLDDGEVRPHGPPGEVGLEAVPLGGDVLQADDVQRVGTVDPEARGGVVHRHPEEHLDVEVAAHRERLAVQRPVDDRPAAHPPRADHHVGLRGRGEELGQVLRAVRTVGVHLDDGVVAPVQGPREPLEVRRAEPLLARPVDDVHPWLALGEGVGDRAGPVGRVVVEDHDVDTRAPPRAVEGR